MSLPVFLELVELKTKVASFLPMLIGFTWSLYYYKTFDALNALLFFVAAISFDMCTTVINNALDYKKSYDEAYRTEDNVVGRFQLPYAKVVGLIFLLLLISLIFSVFLLLRTDLLLLPIGGLCFLIGIGYTFGPLPISRLPLGEVFSGLTMGFGIFFLAVYIHHPQAFLSSQWQAGHLSISLYWWECLKLFWMSLPLVCLIANIMLANNTCDYEQDLKNKRHTLVHYIGIPQALKLYSLLSLLPWAFWLSYLLLGLLPWWSALIFLALPPYIRHLKQFLKKQVKRETFINSIKNFLLFSGLYLVVLIVSIFVA